ncbi:hypothetical protein [Desulfovibrio cuneatus]|uniref:hypothetical protein n=1 Tax=Desulfovibrio cuneatus TaxID=159728 RepID=UPI000429EC78|nr:hypothetical protein [Desulfovibrio cuneatus]
MAITGLVITPVGGQEAAVVASLAALPYISALEPIEDTGRFAAVLEAPMLELETTVNEVLALEGVVSVELALLTCEDELGEEGTIPCPPHKPRKLAKAGT